MKYYIDSCIWLNLFKKEGDSKKGRPYWEIARDFIDKIRLLDNSEIAYSKIVLREIEFKLKDKNVFTKSKSVLEREIKPRLIRVETSDYTFARKLESELKYELSFYDCIHIAICKRLNLILVTRDKDLIKFAGKYVIAEKPEHLVI